MNFDRDNKLGSVNRPNQVDKNVETMLAAVKNFYFSIPGNSPIRSSIIKTIFSECEVSFTGKFLEIDFSSIYKVLIIAQPVKLSNYKALRSDVEILSYFLKKLGFFRDRIGEKLENLNDWFLQRCPPPSGSKVRKYVSGTKESMYMEYLDWCTANGIFIIFHFKFSI